MITPATYSAAGLRTFPVFGIDAEGRCTCGGREGCKPGKHPCITDNLNLATTDLETLRSWYREHRGANIGIAIPEQYVVIDVDGPEGFEALKVAGINLPSTLIGNTGRGCHFWYRVPHPVRPKVGLLQHVDIRGVGSYVVVAPSRHVSGAEYTWPAGFDLGMVVDIPADLLKLIENSNRTVAPSNGNHGPAPALGDFSRHHLMTSEAGRLKNRGASPEQIEKRLQEMNAALKEPKPADEIGRIAAASASWSSPAVQADVHADVAGWPDPPDRMIYHGIFGEMVHAIEPHTEADLTGILAQYLVAFGNCVGGTPYFSIEASRHHINEYLVLVGPTSGGRKGSGFDRARRPFTSVDEAWARDRIMGGVSSGEGVTDAVRDPIEEEQPLKEKGRLVGYQTVRTDPGAPDKRLLVYEPEFARALQVMGRDGCTLSTTIRQAWDTQDLRVMTRGSKLKATGAHISIIGHITQDELLRQMERTEAASGFGNRILWLCVRRSKFLPEGGDVSPEGMAPLETRLKSAVSNARTIGEMKRDEEARQLWRQEYERLATGRPGLLGSMLGRCEAHVTRLSMLYALADRSNLIQRPHLQAALALWDYCERSCRFIFGDNLGDPTADELLRALRAAPDGMSRTEMSDHFGRNKQASELGRALGVLARQGLAIRAPAGERTAGRPAERWRASTRSAE